MIRTVISALALSAVAAIATPASAAITISNTGATPNAWTATTNGYAGAAATVTASIAGWEANSNDSKWVSINPNGYSNVNPTTPNGQYTYATSFTGNVGDVLNFLYWADDKVLSMTVDGVTTAMNSGTYFNSTAGSFAVSKAGINHSLSFTIENNGQPANANPTGFRFQQVGAAVPEPATWAMMMIGFGAVGVAVRRRRSTGGKVAVA